MITVITSRADHRVKIKENEKREKYLDLVRKLKISWSMKVTVILIIIGALGMIHKGLRRLLEELEIGRQAEIFQSTVLLTSTRILRKVLKT